MDALSEFWAVLLEMLYAARWPLGVIGGLIVIIIIVAVIAEVNERYQKKVMAESPV